MSNNGYLWSPGMGVLIGQKWAEGENSIRAQGDELQAMRAELRKVVNGGLYETAFARAAADVTAEIVEELKQEQAGKKGARRLSDPSNTAGRNEAYVNKAASHLSRLSGGRVMMSSEEKARIKASRPVR